MLNLAHDQGTCLPENHGSGAAYGFGERRGRCGDDDSGGFKCVLNAFKIRFKCV